MCKPVEVFEKIFATFDLAFHGMGGLQELVRGDFAFEGKEIGEEPCVFI